MSDEELLESSGYNRVQFSTFVNGDQFVLRTDSGEELAEVAQELANNLQDALKGINAFKQVVVADGVFTGDSSQKGTPKERSVDAPPPSSSDGVPTCKHGPMDDLAGRGYKRRWYCTMKTDNWREKCKPQD